jgi:predicted RNase H-like nuclease (RuvC/YqgF family)
MSGDLEWRLKQMQADMNIMWNRLNDLEEARDEKVKPDAGEPVNKHYIECLKQNAKLVEENDVLRYQYETMKNETARCKSQLDQFEKIVADKQKVLDGEKAAAIRLEESSTYWQQKYNEQLQTTDILNKRLDFFEKLTYDLEMEKNDAKWYREQAIKKCIDIVELIKNDPLAVGGGRGWMVAICEDIQQVIKKEFGVK